MRGANGVSTTHTRQTRLANPSSPPRQSPPLRARRKPSPLPCVPNNNLCLLQQLHQKTTEIPPVPPTTFHPACVPISRRYTRPPAPRTCPASPLRCSPQIVKMRWLRLLVDLHHRMFSLRLPKCLLSYSTFHPCLQSLLAQRRSNQAALSYSRRHVQILMCPNHHS